MNREREQASVLDPQALSDVNTVILLSPAARQLYEIWLKFGTSSKTPEDAALRRIELINWSVALTPGEETFLETPLEQARPEGGKQEVGWGYFVRVKAEQDAESELHRRRGAVKQTEQHTSTSEGGKLNVRRKKAQQRRGTDPKLIH